jgi:acetylornithine deacetylase/succinyl-diaminopimelate desuccinylase-like protein
MREGRRLLNLVQVGEKHSATYRLEVRNPGGHSSMPVPENAIYRLAAAVQKVAALEFPFRLNDVTRAYMTKLASLQEEPLATQLRQAAAGNTEAQRAVAAASPQWNAVMRTTCVATGLDGGHAENALPQTAGARINCRILPDETPEAVEAALRQAISDEKVTVSVTSSHGASPMSPLREDVVGATERLTSELWPGVATVPYMVMGGTAAACCVTRGSPATGCRGSSTRRGTSASTAATSASGSASSTRPRSSCTGSYASCRGSDSADPARRRLCRRVLRATAGRRPQDAKQALIRRSASWMFSRLFA